jgi:aryl-alcohol dehydrogenase-like predicted oxidoreductase
VEFLRPVAERNGKSLSQLAISWVLRRREVTAAIVGAKSPEQIAETSAAGDWDLPPEDAALIDGYLGEHTKDLAAD